MVKLAIFDLDNTLTESRAPISIETGRLLRELLQSTKVAVISGAAFWQFERELLEPLSAASWELDNLYILATSGAELWTHMNGKWKRVYVDKLTNKDKKAVENALMRVLGIDKKELEPLLDNRDSGMTYSALGREAPPDLKKPWDPDHKKRIALVEKLSPLLPGLELTIGGTTSIDITHEGFDKQFGVRKILEYTGISKDDCVFVGDALFQGGNDNPVQNEDVPILVTSGPQGTLDIIKSLLKAPETIDASTISFIEPPVAYFCAEYALDDNSLRFAGGLGVLAADYLYEAAEMNMPLVCLGLWYKDQSYDRYSLVVKDGKPLEIRIPFEQGFLSARLRARKFRNVWLLLIEADDDALASPYSLDDYTWVKQDVYLGLGGAKALEALSIEPRVFHLNEGHSAFAAFEIILREASKRKDKSVLKALKDARKKIVATKHTILKAGSKIYLLDFKHYFGEYCKSLGMDAESIFEIGTDSEVKAFSGTQFVLAAAGKKSAVSAIHAKFEKELHPKSELIPITNGIRIERWLSREFHEKIAYKDILKSKYILRERLVKYANETTGSKLDPNVCTVVWARRFAAYKRPETLISDIERLKKIAKSDHPVQFIISGKVYLDEPSSEKTLQRIIELANHPDWKSRLAYIPDYSIRVAHDLVNGADIWLNTPRLGKEACGTSGMKAGLNGALQVSVSDGWVAEVNWEGKGWILPEEGTAPALYDLLERTIAPMFYDSRGEWIKRMQKTRSIIEKEYTTRRMLKQYLRKLY